MEVFRKREEGVESEIKFSEKKLGFKTKFVNPVRK
jgi:hypothetical protein